MLRTTQSIRKALPDHIAGPLIVLALFFFAGATISAQSRTVGARIVWMDDPDEVIIRDNNGESIQSDFGLMLEGGYSIETANSVVELELVPNGSVVILDADTSFHVDGLAGERRNRASRENAFSLVAGKMRLVAARNTGASYVVRTETAVAGVRGTDFYRQYDPEEDKDWLCVTEGAVQFSSPNGDRSVLVPAGAFVDLNVGFEISRPDEEWLQSNLTLESLQGAELPSR